jgi:hypothetical protein
MDARVIFFNPQFPRRTLAPREVHEVIYEALLLYNINFLSIFQIPSLKTPFPTNEIKRFTRQNSLSIKSRGLTTSRGWQGIPALPA